MSTKSFDQTRFFIHGVQEQDPVIDGINHGCHLSSVYLSPLLNKVDQGMVLLKIPSENLRTGFDLQV